MTRPGVARIVRLYTSTPRYVRRFAGASLLLGIALGVAGAFLVAPSFWATNAFVGDLASSLVSGLVGLPVAVVLISGLTEAAARYRSRLSVQQGLRESANEIVRLRDEILRGARDIERVPELAYLGATWAGAKPDVRWATWNRLLNDPRETLRLLARVDAAWGSIASKRRDVVENGWAWVNPDIEREFAAIREAMHLVDEALERPSTSSASDSERPPFFDVREVGRAVTIIARVCLQAEHLRNTFLFEVRATR